MPKHINTFTKGLDKDTNVNAYSNETYPHALNLRILSEESLKSGTLTNIEDHFPLLTSSVEEIVGTATINNKLVIFSRKLSGGGLGEQDSIGYVRIVALSDLMDNVSLVLENLPILVSKKFSFGDSIDVVARYETNAVQKVYWVDGKNPLRVINIAESNLSTKPLSYFNVIQEVVLSEPKFKGILPGSLKTGSYQYAYCLFNRNGAETAYSSATSVIPISLSTFTNSNSYGFKGSHSGEESSLGVAIELNGLDTRFTNIRMIRLYYSTQDGVPEIDIIYEGSLQEDMVINDYGGITLGTIIFEDYRYIPNLFVASTLESKNDYLFAGNIKESYFNVDVDMRAYRFSNNLGTVESKVWNKIPISGETWDSLDSKTISSGSPNWNVDSDYVVNPYNVPGVTHPVERRFKYQKNGITIGGEGKNIKYRFVTKTRPLETVTGNSSKPFWYYTEGYQDTSNPVVLETNLGYQRGEVYRFGIVFYDKYGRQSFVRWIDDVKIPDENDSFPFIILEGITPKVSDLLIEFTFTSDFIDNLPNTITGFQIVRAERTYAEATVKDCGYLGNLLLTNTPNKGKFARLFGMEHDGGGTSTSCEYITPETNYNKNNNINYPVFSITNYYLATPSSTAISKAQYPWVPNSTYQIASPVIQRLLPEGGTSTANYSVSGTLLVKASKSAYTINGMEMGLNLSLDNYYQTNYTVKDTIKVQSYVAKGTTLLVKLSSWLPDGANRAYGRRISTAIPYGGYSKNAIEQTMFYPASGIHQLALADNNGGGLGQIITTLEVANGDCYIGIFEYMRGLCTTDDTIVKTTPISHFLGSEILYLPVETKINLKYGLNEKFSTLDNGERVDVSVSQRGKLFQGIYTYNAMWETKGVHQAGNSEDFTQEFDLYTYNPVYSTMNKSKVFMVKPPDLQTTASYPYRVIRTSRKINGEVSDTWTKFPVNNFIDLDTAQGGLSKLLTFQNNLLFFQESGVGILPIEDREVVSTESGNTTTIGVGGVMERYDYISRSSGTNTIHGALHSNNAVYYADTFNNKLCRVGESIEFLSDTKGLKSALPKTLTKPSLLFNAKYNEVWFNVSNTQTFTFNEYTNTFVSQVDEYFKFGTSVKDSVFAIGSNTINRLNLLDSIREWELDLVLNPNNFITNRYDSLTFGSINSTSNVSLPFETIQFTNRYQDSGVIPVDEVLLRRRFRNWTINKIREAGTKERFYDSYMRVSITGSNAVELYDVLTEYSAINTL